MRKYLTTALAITLMSGVSYADLQNVEVNGSLRMRGNSYFNVESNDDYSANQSTEQRTTLGIKADFTDNVSANITFDNYGIWGDDRRIKGSNGVDSVSLHEAYITLGDAIAGFDLKIGRQEVMLGSEFIIGNNSTGSNFNHVSFDGIVATYSGDTFDVTLLSLKENEEDGFNSSEVDEDDDLYAIYVTYTGFEDHTIDGYVFFERQGASGAENGELFTIGARAAGTFDSFDYELELATQTGDALDDTVEYEGHALNSELGYTFDIDMQPRVYLGAALLMGTNDNGEIGFVRTHSDWEYSKFLDNGDMSNVLAFRIGADANVSEKIGVGAVVSYFKIDVFDSPYEIHNDAVPVSGDDENLGWEIGIHASYQYSDDVSIEVGAAQLINGDAIEDAYEASGGDDEDQTYIYAEISLSF